MLVCIVNPEMFSSVSAVLRVSLLMIVFAGCRVEFLRHQKEQQLRELQELEETKENVTEKAEHIAERLELCHDNNVNLLRRCVSQLVFFNYKSAP